MVRKFSAEVSIRPFAIRLNSMNGTNTFNLEETCHESRSIVHWDRRLNATWSEWLSRSPASSAPPSDPRQPSASALAMLFSEVEQTNRAANAHFATLSENHWS